MTHVYAVSGTVFQRNEFMRGYSDYERSWSFSEERYMAESLEEAAQKVAPGHGVHEDKYGLVEIRDLKITDLGKLKTRGSISLQTGKPYNCTTLISVPARNIRSAEGEGFISMRGAMRCEVMYQDKTWHAKKHDLSAEWFLDCPVGEEPEIRRRGRIALEADQTPSDERKEVMDPQERNRQYPIVEEGEPVEVSFSYQGKSLVARWNGLTYKNEQRRVDFWEVGKEHLIRKAHLANHRLSHCGEGEGIGTAAAVAVGLL